jgi:hypothetical protein
MELKTLPLSFRLPTGGIGADPQAAREHGSDIRHRFGPSKLSSHASA